MDRNLRARRPHHGSNYPQSYANGALGPSWPAVAGPSRPQNGAIHHRPSTNMPYPGHGSHNGRLSPGQVDFINERGDKALALEEVVQEAVLVLRLKNAISQLADIVDLYDALDHATGYLDFWKLYARRHFQDIENAVEDVRTLVNEMPESSYRSPNSATRSMLEIAAALDTFESRWVEAYQKEWNKHGSHNKSDHPRKSNDFYTGWFLEDMKEILRGWRPEGMKKTDKWLRGVKERCAAMRSSFATQATSSRHAYGNGYY